mmetsp:Transcript_30313/g.47470  ORF Transcript_30313/g.47470 Transcript_30313/m.47470 type:complete len:610 (-) Transcript_30313:1942-3771(-)
MPSLHLASMLKRPSPHKYPFRVILCISAIAVKFASSAFEAPPEEDFDASSSKSFERLGAFPILTHTPAETEELWTFYNIFVDHGESLSFVESHMSIGDNSSHDEIVDKHEWKEEPAAFKTWFLDTLRTMLWKCMLLNGERGPHNAQWLRKSAWDSDSGKTRQSSELEDGANLKRIDIPIYVINLRHRKDKRLHMEQLLQSLGFTDVRISQSSAASEDLDLDGPLFHEEWMPGHAKPSLSNDIMSIVSEGGANSMNTLLAYIARARDQLVILEKHIKSGDQLVAIFEDDLLPIESAEVTNKAIHLAIHDLPKTADLLYLEFCSEDCGKIQYKPNQSLMRLFNPSCSAALLFTKKGMRLVVDLSVPQWSSLDTMYSLFIKEGDLEAYSTRRPIFFQDTYWSSDALREKSNAMNSNWQPISSSKGPRRHGPALDPCASSKNYPIIGVAFILPIAEVHPFLSHHEVYTPDLAAWMEFENERALEIKLLVFPTAVLLGSIPARAGNPSESFNMLNEHTTLFFKLKGAESWTSQVLQNLESFSTVVPLYDHYSCFDARYFCTVVVSNLHTEDLPVASWKFAEQTRQIQGEEEGSDVVRTAAAARLLLRHSSVHVL